MFHDRLDAGRQLGQALLHLRREQPLLVLGLPRGGVVVAREVARALNAPLEVWVVRKLGAPDQPELAVGALSEGGEVLIDAAGARESGTSRADLERIVACERIELQRRMNLFRGGRPRPKLRGRMAVVVDDGIATGLTMEAALRDLLERRARRLVAAVPVAAWDSLERLRPLVSEVICLQPTEWLGGIGAWYDDFRQTGDDEVLALLDDARRALESAQPGAP